ncbi:hypothetical protein, partial [Comamonas aquatica]
FTAAICKQVELEGAAWAGHALNLPHASLEQASREVLRGARMNKPSKTDLPDGAVTPEIGSPSKLSP